MKVHVDLATEYGGESYLVDTDNIADDDLKNAIEFCLLNVGEIGHCGRFGVYEVIHGSIMQTGYAMNDELQRLHEDDGIPSVSVSTDI